MLPSVESVLEQMRQMSAADISVLEASVRTADSAMLSAPGSANEALWSEMEKLGWMVRRPVEADLPPDTRPIGPAYTIIAAGREPIQRLLAMLQADPGKLQTETPADDAQVRQLVELHNRTCHELVPQIVDPVRALGGQPIDVAILITSIVVGAIERGFRPKYYDEVLDHVMAEAKKRLSAIAAKHGSSS